MQISSRGGATRISAHAYRLELRPDPPRAVLADHHGRIWSSLCLLADLDRTDRADESYGSTTPTWEATPAGGLIEVGLPTSAWRSKTVRLRCAEDALELTVAVEGAGTLTDLRLLGGHAVLPGGAAGAFRSSIAFASVFSPNPTEPVQVVRPAGMAATLGVVGDARPGRLHAVFSPPPLCLVLGRRSATAPTDVPAGEWLSVSVQGPVEDLRFPELAYEPVDDGWWLRLDYDGHTRVNGRFETPPVVLRPVADPWAALAAYRSDLADRGWVGSSTRSAAAWWRQPMFCGWGAQCAEAPLPGRPPSRPRTLDDLPPVVRPVGVPDPRDLSAQSSYDRWLNALARHGVVPGTVVVDDRWQQAYGLADPDPVRWPDLRGWVARRHAAGQRVLLWWKAWDPAGVPAAECVRDPSGAPVAVDPGSAAYRTRLRAMAAAMIGAEGLDADGLKIDFTQRAPTGRRLVGADDSDGGWGIAALHRLLATLHRAVTETKPDALVITHTPHPAFGDVTDMIRLNDVLELDAAGQRVPVVDQLRFRAAVAQTTLPDHPIDTDQWPMPDRAEWRRYRAAQPDLGVPALYYVDRIDTSDEPLAAGDLAAVAQDWASYRARQNLVAPSLQSLPFRP